MKYMRIKKEYLYVEQRVKVPRKHKTFVFMPSELKQDDIKWMSRYKEFDYLWLNNDESPNGCSVTEVYDIQHIRYEW